MRKLMCQGYQRHMGMPGDFRLQSGGAMRAQTLRQLLLEASIGWLGIDAVHIAAMGHCPSLLPVLGAIIA